MDSYCAIHWPALLMNDIQVYCTGGIDVNGTPLCFVCFDHCTALSEIIALHCQKASQIGEI
eukprot:2079842-Prymnesium_polylepis.1